MSRIQYINDRNGNFQEAHGSDGRLNVSSRSDSRAYYNSRDVGRTFSMTFDHDGAVAGQDSAYWKNDSEVGRQLVITDIELNAEQSDAVACLKFVTGTAAGGSSVTPVNLNRTKSVLAEATCREGQSGDPLTGLTDAGFIELISVSGHVDIDVKDRVRLGQGDAFALEYNAGTTGRFYGTIFGFYEE